MRAVIDSERDIVAYEKEGLTITVTQRATADVIETPLGDCLQGAVRPLYVSVETPDHRIVHAVIPSEDETLEELS